MIKKQGLQASEEEIDLELQKILNKTPDPKLKEKINTKEYRNYIKRIITSRKAIKWLKEQIVY